MGIEKRRNGTYVDTIFRWPMKVVGAAQCDYSTFPIKKTDQVKQMEYDGQGLYFTGFLVHRKFADKPQPQLLKPNTKNDPISIRDARPIPIGNNY